MLQIPLVLVTEQGIFESVSARNLDDDWSSKVINLSADVGIASGMIRFVSDSLAEQQPNASAMLGLIAEKLEVLSEGIDNLRVQKPAQA